MPNILLCSQKGGVGKSLIADEICFFFERLNIPFSFFDLDKQGGTIHQDINNPKSIISIIDTPGFIENDLAAYLAESDLIICPTCMTSRDIPPLLTIDDILDTYPNKKALFILNRWNRYNACRDFLDWFTKNINKPYFLIPQSELFVKAAALKKSVVDIAPNSKAAIAVNLLLKSITKEVITFV